MQKSIMCCSCHRFLSKYDENKLKYANNYFCPECLYKYLTTKNRPMTSDEAHEKVKQLVEDRKQQTELMITRDNFYRWLIVRYDINELPPQFLVKIKKIQEGTFKEYPAIPLNHLADMWTQRMDMLHKINYDKNLFGLNAMNYDLAVILSHYDSYKAYVDSRDDTQEDVKIIRKRIAMTMNVHYNGRERDTGVSESVEELENMFNGK